jgi:uncharacterized membrane protein YccF (DUF307 family)
MSLLGNLIWLVCGGLFAAIGYIVSGLGLCLTIVGIPFGIQTMKIGIATLAPFGKDVVELPHANSTLRVVFNVIWIVLFGWEMVIGHIVLALILGLTIVGIPFAKQHIKLIPIALLPFGRDLRRV